MSLPTKYRVIYQPAGRAREYSQLAINLANGCIHGCKYCYVPRITRKEMKDFHSGSTHRKDILKKLELDLKDMVKNKDRRMVMFSFTTDPYQPIEGFNQMTRDALALFRKYDQPFHLLTKGGKFAREDFDLYGENDWYASSLTFYDEINTQKIEPNTSTPRERMNALKEAHRRGIKTWVSFEPVLIADHTIRLFLETKDYVDFYKIGKITGYDEFPVDWEHFANKIAAMMEANKKPFFIKHDLRPHLTKDVSEYKYHREMK